MNISSDGSIHKEFVDLLNGPEFLIDDKDTERCPVCGIACGHDDKCPRTLSKALKVLADHRTHLLALIREQARFIAQMKKPEAPAP